MYSSLFIKQSFDKCNLPNGSPYKVSVPALYIMNYGLKFYIAVNICFKEFK